MNERNTETAKSSPWAIEQIGKIGHTVEKNPALLFAAPLAIGALGGAFGAGAAGGAGGTGAAGVATGAEAAIPAGYSGLASIPGAADMTVIGSAAGAGGAGSAIGAGLGGAAAGSAAGGATPPPGPSEPSGPSIGQGSQGPPEPSGGSSNFFHKIFKQFGSMPHGGGGGSQPQQAMTMPFVDRSPPQPTFLPINRPQTTRPNSRDLLIQELGRNARGNRP